MVSLTSYLSPITTIKRPRHRHPSPFRQGTEVLHLSYNVRVTEPPCDRRDSFTKTRDSGETQWPVLVCPNSGPHSCHNKRLEWRRLSSVDARPVIVQVGDRFLPALRLLFSCPLSVRDETQSSYSCTCLTTVSFPSHTTESSIFPSLPRVQLSFYRRRIHARPNRHPSAREPGRSDSVVRSLHPQTSVLITPCANDGLYLGVLILFNRKESLNFWT